MRVWVTGGRDALESTQGRDCTALFESYHAFVDRPHAMLAALKEVRLLLLLLLCPLVCCTA